MQRLNLINNWTKIKSKDQLLVLGRSQEKKTKTKRKCKNSQHRRISQKETYIKSGPKYHKLAKPFHLSPARLSSWEKIVMKVITFSFAINLTESIADIGISCLIKVNSSLSLMENKLLMSFISLWILRDCMRSIWLIWLQTLWKKKLLLKGLRIQFAKIWL